MNETHPIKVLFGINKLVIGGAERILVEEITNIDTSRFDPYLVTLLPSTSPNFDDSVSSLGAKWKRFSFTGLLDVRSWFALYRYLKRERFDVVITNLFFTSFHLRTAAIAAGVPVILSTELNIYSKRSALWIFAEKFLAHFTYRIIVNSKEVLAQAARQLGLPKEKFFLNYSMVDLKKIGPASPQDRAALRTKYGIPEDAVVIASVGRLVEQKGQGYLVDAFASLPDRDRMRLFVFGEGVRRDELTTRIKEKGIEQIAHLPGAAKIQDIIALADVFVLPSLWEGMPMALLEAMAGGLPVIATRVSGSEELVVEGINGFLVAPKDSSALAEKIALLAGDTDMRTRFGIASRNEAQKYSLENHLAALYGLIEEGIRRTRS